MEKLIESLSPIERKIIPFLKEGNLDKLSEKSGTDKDSSLRALEFLSNKGVLKIISSAKKIIELEVNGILYLKQGLPERKLINLVAEKNSISILEASKLVSLNENELKAAIGALRKKALINVINENIVFTGKKQEIIEKTLEEKFLESLPKNFDELLPEEKYAFENLIPRKNIISVNNKKTVEFSITELGEELIKQDLKSAEELIEGITPELLKANNLKGKKFRRYDILSPVPKISGGKRHFVNQAIEHAKKIWLEMGFKEMTGTIMQTGFWNFDALFTPQDHPARELHDTFYIKDFTGKLPDKKIAQAVKNSHEKGVTGSRGWNYKWKEEEAKKVLLRTHTTCLSAQTLAKLDISKLPAKYFAVGKCFRNDTVDWSHGFEFNQTEGIVIDENANLKNLIGYLKEFANKMGYKKVRFRPHFFPYTEPSLEGDVWNEERKEWMEVFAAGIFRPEVTEPLLGKPIPVLAWGPGLDRMLMLIYKIRDMRELYKNDLDMLREIKSWLK